MTDVGVGVGWLVDLNRIIVVVIIMISFVCSMEETMNACRIRNGEGFDDGGYLY